MELSKILDHCVVVEITGCEKDSYWYADLVGEHLVAYGYDSDWEQVHCCHVDNTHSSTATLPIEHCKFVQGDLNQLEDMS